MPSVRDRSCTIFTYVVYFGGFCFHGLVHYMLDSVPTDTFSALPPGASTLDAWRPAPSHQALSIGSVVLTSADVLRYLEGCG